MKAGVWVAYYSDFSSIVLFDDELLAMRYAITNHMEVKHMDYGVPIGEQA